MGKHFAILALISLFTFGILAGNSPEDAVSENGPVENYPYINQMILESSRYTQTEESSAEVLANYHDLYTLSYTDAELNTLGFELMFDTPELSVWFEKDSFSMMVKNKATGYFWSSRAEFQGMSGLREDNIANRCLMDSGLWVEYVRADNLSSAKTITESLYSLAEVEFENNGSITPEKSDHLRPYQLAAGTYNYHRVETTLVTQSANAFMIHVDLKQLEIAFDVEFTLTDGAVGVRIPNSSIVESGETNRLLSISVFPYFGSIREDEMPGYLMIPDGVGALIRTNQRYNTYFQSAFYGDDYGYNSGAIPQLSVPIYGVIHEAGANGFYADVTEGSQYSTLISYFWGDKTRYNRIYTRFNLRQIYWTVIDKAGNGNESIPDAIRTSDFAQTYHFLSDDDADYVGMATNYRDDLLAKGILSENETITGNQIPIQLSYIMSDRQPAFLGTTAITMTTVSQVRDAYSSFRDAGLLNQQIILCGWSKDGFVNRAPYTTRISGKRAYEQLIADLEADGNAVYLYDDYVVGSELATRLTYNLDIAKNLSRLKMVADNVTLDGQVTEMRLLYPERSLILAEKDLDFFNDLGAGVSLDSIGYNLFSYFDGTIHERGESIATYQALCEQYEQLLLNMPSQYLFQYADGYLDMPITNSQFDYYTDLAPILPIILKGSLSYYTPYLNFNALGIDRLLMMVDFGINPSYILTAEETYRMRYTAASVYYTTTLSEYEDEIIETYQFLNNALGSVVGEQIVSRDVLATGLVRITYSNQVSIYVNYGTTAKNVDAITVEGRSYEVVRP